jgi:hypothetical protein
LVLFILIFKEAVTQGKQFVLKGNVFPVVFSDLINFATLFIVK